MDSKWFPQTITELLDERIIFTEMLITTTTKIIPLVFGEFAVTAPEKRKAALAARAATESRLQLSLQLSQAQIFLMNLKYLKSIEGAAEYRQEFISGCKKIIHVLVQQMSVQCDEIAGVEILEIMDYNKKMMDSLRSIWEQVVGSPYWLKLY